MHASRSPVLVLVASLNLLALVGGVAPSLAADPSSVAGASASERKSDPEAGRSLLVERVLLLLSPDAAERERSTQWLVAHWDDQAIPMLIELVPFMHDRSSRRLAVELLQARTGEKFGTEMAEWQRWLWARPPFATSALAEFKRLLYGLLDPRFEAYFAPGRSAAIRLDEVVWGGVAQDGIPPLRSPKMVSAAASDYLAESDIVFALSLEGDARAYPKRIMGWHEMFIDTVGGVPVAGVYCTLCGTMVLYETTRNGVHYELGTSGFLFRSNKLMYDRATQSLWNTLWGQPVVGPLVKAGVRLERRPIVTTTWGEWRRRHPRTRVLDIATGHRRDYTEGAAYRDYYETDRLAFPVPRLDDRLKNKAEVLALIFAGGPGATPPLAIASEYLRAHPLYHGKLGGVSFVVLTDVSGANRVYRDEGVSFKGWDGDRSLLDDRGGQWQLSEASLRSSQGRELARLPAHRAFWFAWYSAHPDTALIQ